MCNEAAVGFGRRVLRTEDVKGRSVLEVGSRMVQDAELSVRRYVEDLTPATYIGVDIFPGPGVDQIASVYDLVRTFGANSFDVVISTELVEHVADWRDAFSNLKRVLSPLGLLVVTTRSPGFPYHGWPHDYWRYTLEDMRAILTDMDAVTVEVDPSAPGVFATARKSEDFSEADLSNMQLFSIIGRRPRRKAPGRVRCASYVFALRFYGAFKRLRLNQRWPS